MVSMVIYWFACLGVTNVYGLEALTTTIYTMDAVIKDKVQFVDSLWSHVTRSRLSCSIECSSHPTCSTFFYSNKTRTCVGHSLNPAMLGTFVSGTGFQYFMSRPGGCPSAYTYDYTLASCFKVYNTALTFSAARDVCAQDGGQLATVETAQKKNMLRGSLGAPGTAWLGATKVNGEFQWQDGRNVSDGTTFWDSSNAADDPNLCAVMDGSNYYWILIDCGATYEFFCEILV